MERALSSDLSQGWCAGGQWMGNCLLLFARLELSGSERLATAVRSWRHI